MILPLTKTQMETNLNKIKAREIMPGCHGKVIHGEKRGRELGYPTANIEICNSYRINGIFLVSILLEHKRLFGLASWGDKPTFSGK